MSRTNRFDIIPGEVYPTPEWPVHRLLDVYQPPGYKWAEPCAGEGDIIQAVNSYDKFFCRDCQQDKLSSAWCKYCLQDRPEGLTGPKKMNWTANEIRPECEKPLSSIIANETDGIVRIGSVFDLSMDQSPGGEGWDVILTNPPFSMAMDIIQHCLPLSDVLICLLSLNYLGTVKRNEFFVNHMPTHIFVIPNRISFRVSPTSGKVGTDACEYGWYVWEKQGNSYSLSDRSVGSIQVLDLTPREVLSHAKRKVKRRASEGC